MDEWQSLPLLRVSEDHRCDTPCRRSENLDSLIMTMRRTCDLAEPERYELDEAPRYRFDLNRRHFLGVTSAGLLILAKQEALDAQTRTQHETVAARLHIDKQGRIAVITSKVEVGQGSRTQLLQAAAEELRVPLTQLELVMADTAQGPDDGGTAGSRTTPSTVPAVRRGAAAAREILVQLARQQWGVVAGALKVDRGK